MGARYFALISGIIYVLLGIFGFVPGMVATPGTGGPSVALNTGYGYLLSTFPNNFILSLVHVATGVWGLIAYRGFYRSRSYSRSVAILYGVLAIMGLLPVLNTAFTIMPLFGSTIWLHTLTALIAAFFGFKTLTAQELREHERELVTNRSRYR